MKNKGFWIGAGLAGAGLLAWTFYKRGRQVNFPVLDNFDLGRYLGQWYEIARLDYFWEKGLSRVSAAYSLNRDGSIRVQNRGYHARSGTWKESVGRARPAGAEGTAELEVSFFGPFYAPYRVIALDEEYRYALVAGKDHSYLWLLSREKDMPESTRVQYLKIAAALGFDTGKLVWVDQGD